MAEAGGVIPDLLIRGALVVTADAAGRSFAGDLAVAGGRVAALGPDLSHLEPAAREVVDARGRLLMPGLVNAHCHAGDSLFRGLVEGLPLEAWLQRVWRAERAILTPDTVRLGARLGFAELLLAGVTTVLDMFWHPRVTIAAARDAGVRVATGGIALDGPGIDAMAPDERLREADAILSDHAGDPLVIGAVVPHSAYTCSPETLHAFHALAERRGALFHTHAAETRAEQATVAERHGRSVIRHMDALGLLTPRTTLAHCVHLDDEEIAVLARSGAAVAHNPVSNLKLASGVARVPDLLAAGVPVALGTDGAISGNDLDPWLALRLAATLHKGVTGRADAVGAAEAVAMATRMGARAVGAEDRLGSLEVGKEADLVLLDLRRPHAVPLFDAATHLAFSAGRGDVREVWVAGERVVRDGRLVRVDLDATLDAVAAMAPAIAATQA